MLKFKTKKSDEVKTSPLTKKSNAVAKATMFFATLIATMFCFAVTAFADDDPLTVVNNLSTFIFGLIRAVGAYHSCLGYCSGRIIVSNPRPVTAL